MEPGFLINKTPEMNENTADRIFDRIDQIEQQICKLKADTANLQRLKDKYQIYSQVYQNDYDVLKCYYKTLKERLNSFYEDPVEEIETKPVIEKSADISSKPIIDDSQNTGKSLSLEEIPWTIQGIDPYYSKSTVSLRYTLKSGPVICSVSFDSTGQRFAFADGKSVFLINTSDGSLLMSFDIPHSVLQNEIHTRALIFSPDDNYILIADNSSIIIFSIQNRGFISTLNEHQKTVSSLLFLPDGRLLSGGFDGLLCVWDFKTGTLLKKILHGPQDDSQREKDDMIISLSAAFDQSFIAIGFMNGAVGIYEPSFTQSMNKFTAHSQFMLNVASAKQSLLLATSSHDNTVKIWSLRNIASCKQTLTGHSNCVLTSCFSNDDTIIFSGSKDESIRGWDVKTGNHLFTINAHNNTLFKIDHHPTEKCFVACSGDGIVCLYTYKPK